MELNIPEVNKIVKLIRETGELTEEGAPVTRTFTMEELTTYRTFLKAVDEATKGHNDLVKEKNEEYSKDDAKPEEVAAKLNSDTEIVASFMEAREVKIEGKVKELMRKCFNDYKYQADDFVIIDLMEKL